MSIYEPRQLVSGGESRNTFADGHGVGPQHIAKSSRRAKGSAAGQRRRQTGRKGIPRARRIDCGYLHRRDVIALHMVSDGGALLAAGDHDPGDAKALLACSGQFQRLYCCVGGQVQ